MKDNPDPLSEEELADLLRRYPQLEGMPVALSPSAPPMPRVLGAREVRKLLAHARRQAARKAIDT